MDFLLLQVLYHMSGAAAINLFRMTEAEVDGPLGGEPFPKEGFDGLQGRNDPGLVIDGAPAPDAAIGDQSAEGCDGPFIQGGGFYGHHIIMAHQDQRFQGRVGALPFKYERELIDERFGKSLMDQRVGSLYKGPEGGESGGIDGGAIGIGYRGELYGLTEMADRRIGQGKKRGSGASDGLGVGFEGDDQQDQEEEQQGRGQGNDGFFYHNGDEVLVSVR